MFSKAKLIHTLRSYISSYILKFLYSWRRKYKASMIKKKKLKAVAKYGIIDDEELIKILKSLNIKEGDVLFVQCSFNDLYTYSGSPFELLDCLKEVIGPTGTLLFPAYTDTSKFKKGKPVDLNLLPTYTGIVSEVFRRSKGVIRSFHPRHSICGYGALAKDILKDHYQCKYADGLGSPFDRMQKLENSKILTIGLPSCHISFLHWVEDIEPRKLPFPVHKKKPVMHKLIFPDGSNQEINDFEVDRSIVSLSLPKLCRKLSKNVIQLTSQKGISMNVYLMKPLAKELLKLRNEGIIHYKQER